MTAFWKWILSLFKSKPTPTPTPGPVVTPPTDDGFVFGQWTVLPSENMTCAKTALEAPLAKLATFVVSGHSASVTYPPDAKPGTWWAMDAFRKYGPYGVAYFVEGKWWFGHVGWFVGDGRTRLTDFSAFFRTDTPFAKHPPVVGCPAYVIVYGNARADSPRSNAVRVEWK
jgi:hypothetical protein